MGYLELVPAWLLAVVAFSLGFIVRWLLNLVDVDRARHRRDMTWRH